jgi:hypothetical protein
VRSSNDPIKFPRRTADGGRRDWAVSDGAVRCPRKGPLADTIAWARCTEMNAGSPMACAEHSCRQQDVALHAIEVRKHLGGVYGPDGTKRHSAASGPKVLGAPRSRSAPSSTDTLFASLLHE